MPSSISVIKECHQIAFSLFFFLEDLFGYIPGISTTSIQPRNSSMGRCGRSNWTKSLTRNTNFTRNADLWAFWKVIARAYECEGASNYHTLFDPILCQSWRLQNVPYKVAACSHLHCTLLRSQAGGYCHRFLLGIEWKSHYVTHHFATSDIAVSTDVGPSLV